MKNNKLMITASILMLSFILSGCGNAVKTVDTPDEVQALPDEGTDIYVASDLHYLAPVMNDKGEAYKRYTAVSDGKNLDHIDKILNAFKNDVVEKTPDVLVLSGDLTNNGDKESHLALADALEEIEDAGTKVFVTPGNHDINNPHARSFIGSKQTKVESVTPMEFSEIYGEYGFSEAFMRDEHSLSYVAEASDDVWILLVDTSKYKRNIELNYPETGGIISLGTFTWMKEVLSSAEVKGAEVITVSHHNALIHSPIAVEDYIIDNNEEYLNIVRRHGVRLNLTGHIHIQDIKSTDEKEPFYEISTNALSVYPHKYGMLRVLPDLSMEYESARTDLRDVMAGSSLKEFRSLEDWSRDYFEKASVTRMHARFMEESNATKEDADLMAEAIGKLNVLYFGGDEDKVTQEMLSHEGLKIMSKYSEDRSAYYMDRILNEIGPDDNRLSIPARKH
ncbi:metallophosphoesterase [Proteiniclasticum sp.]|uniref:metallophosphoesterase n=1 Tax=Proteiniclasticum sp. TaxID=2053595 RepID=UPI00289857EE|nr:metallophosphoesterase [Proteiniclasticum sp.]